MTEQKQGQAKSGNQGRSGGRRRRRGRGGQKSAAAAGKPKQADDSAGRLSNSHKKPSPTPNNKHHAGKQKSTKNPEPAAKDQTKPEAQERPEAPFVHVTKRYAVLFYDNLPSVKADLDLLKEKSAAVDQLNIVIRAEANMDDPDLNSIEKIKVFAGSAWTLIHERRLADGWYEQPR